MFTKKATSILLCTVMLFTLIAGSMSAVYAAEPDLQSVTLRRLTQEEAAEFGFSSMAFYLIRSVLGFECVFFYADVNPEVSATDASYAWELFDAQNELVFSSEEISKELAMISSISSFANGQLGKQFMFFPILESGSYTVKLTVTSAAVTKTASSVFTFISKYPLFAAMQEGKGVKSYRYSADSYAALAAALEAGQSIYDTENPTQAQVDKAIADINAALAGLESRFPSWMNWFLNIIDRIIDMFSGMFGFTVISIPSISLFA